METDSDRKRPLDDGLRRELVEHFTAKQDDLRRLWVERMTTRGLVTGLSEGEVESQFRTIHDLSLACLESDDPAAVEQLAERTAGRGALEEIAAERIIVGLLILQGNFARSLTERYGADPQRMRSAVEVFEPIAMAIVSSASLALIREQGRLVVRQQEAMLELSTPVLQFRERLLLLPIVGLIDSQRAQQLTEQLLRAIRDQRALVVVVDITGVVAVDSAVANHLMHTVEAARLMGATVIVTGVSAEVAQTLVTLGIELGKLNTVGDLQGGIDAADRIAGYVLVRDRSTLAAASSSGD